MEIIIQRGDITMAEADCIVNAANPGLLRGAGVCGAIFNAAGSELDAYIAATEHHGCPTGGAKITPAFGELYKNGVGYIIHAVGPDTRFYSKPEIADELLVMAYQSAMELAMQYEIKSIAFPTISTGVYGFDVKRAAFLAIGSVLLYDGQQGCPKVTFVAFDEENEKALIDQLIAITNRYEAAKAHSISKVKQ